MIGQSITRPDAGPCPVGRRLALLFCLVVLFMCLSTGAVADQPGTLLWEVDGTSYNEYLGNAVANAGDVNHDGYEDVAAGAPSISTVYVLSGLDGSVLRTFTGNNVTLPAQLGYSLASAGDFNGDGTSDILAGANSKSHSGAEPGYARVLSGADGCDLSPAGCVLLEVKGYWPLEFFGTSVAVLGDLTGDGTAEILVGAPGMLNTAPGAARVFSGSTGALLWEFTGSGTESLGRSVAAAGDVNGDGVPDMLVGAPKAAGKKAQGVGRVVLYSGNTTFSLLKAVYGKKAGDGLGWSVAGAGLMDADTVPDIIYGASGVDKKKNVNVGQVTVLSGRKGKRLYKITGTSAQMSLGFSVAGAGDVNKDDADDFLIGAPGFNSSGGHVRLVSGRTGAILFSYDGAPGDSVGFGIPGFATADVNGDGKLEIIVGAPSATRNSSFGAGYVKVFLPPPTP